MSEQDGNAGPELSYLPAESLSQTISSIFYLRARLVAGAVRREARMGRMRSRGSNGENREGKRVLVQSVGV